MPEGKRPDSRRRTPASRPAKPGAGNRGRPRGGPPARREPRVIEPRATGAGSGESGSNDTTETIRQHIVASAEQQSEQRFGSTARRAAILAAVVCVLTLTIAGPVRTYFAQRTEMMQLKAAQEQLREQIAELEEQKLKLADPAYIAAQARERLGFVMPGDIPYQVQLPPGADVPEPPDAHTAIAPSNEPWYTALWRTIADEPHGVSPPAGPAPGEPGEPGAPGPGAPPAPGEPVPPAEPVPGG
ncbi:FtsB family cell division protein [Mycolicibacterium thermoresistibile]